MVEKEKDIVERLRSLDFPQSPYPVMFNGVPIVREAAEALEKCRDANKCLRDEIERLRGVLSKIANLDYRGNREQGSVIAYEALGQERGKTDPIISEAIDHTNETWVK